MGDVALVSPVVHSVLEQNPELTIVLVTKEFFHPFFNQHPRLILEVFDSNKNDGVFGLKKLQKALIKKYKIDAVCDLHDVLRSNILNFYFKTSGFKVFKIDKGRKEKKQMIASKKIEPPLKHSTQRYLDVFNEALNKEASIDYNFELQANENITSFLTNQGLQDKTSRWIGVAPFAKHSTKVWGIYKIKQLIDELLEQNVSIFMFGGGDDELNQLNEIAKEFPQVIVVSGKLNLKEELTFIKQLDLMVTMDSSNMHMASILGLKVVSVWGSTHPSLGFAPFNNEKGIVRTKLELTCQPCSVFGNKPCERGDHICMTSIETKDVLKKINF